MKRNQWITGLSSAAAVAAVCLSVPFSSYGADDGTFPEGISVGKQSLAGMTKEEAGKTVTDYVEGLSDQTITLSIAGEEVVSTARDLGFHWSNTDAVEEAAGIYRGGNIIERYMATKDLQDQPVVIPLETALDTGKLETFVQDKCAPYIQEPKDATITRVGEEFQVTPSEMGRAVDISATKTALDTALAGGLDEPIKVEVAVAESQPARTTESLSTIKDQLGVFKTSFNAGNSSRTKNLKTGVSKINGAVLMPGEEFSAYTYLTPFTVANGYATAASYENGKVVDTVGGGACQICTTLYNTVLLSELEVTQRQNHSMIVTYVNPSADAAIAGTYKDLKFKNNYSTPIYLEGNVSGNTLTFAIYGQETRPANRTIKFVSETLGSTDPGEPTVKVDPSLRPGQRVTEQSSHRGLRSRLWKCVYVDGVETEKTLLHTDSYSASKAIVRVGPEVAAVAPVLPAAPDPSLPVTPETPEQTQPAQTQPQGPGYEPGPGAPEPEPEPQPGTEAGPGA